MMTKYMDDMISPYPIRIVDLKVDPSRLKLQHLKIGQVGHLPGRTLYREKAVFKEWALVFIADGRGVYQEGEEKETEVQGGAYFFFEPGKEYCFGPKPAESWDEYYINFRGPRVQEWLREGLVFQGEVKTAPEVHKWVHKLEALIQLMDSGIPTGADRAALQLEALLYELMISNDSGREGDDEHWPEILEDLNRMVYEPLHPELIACRHHISVSTLRRITKAHTGYPLGDYATRLKVGEAKHLLINTNLQIQEIAHLLGYKDPLYFSRVFKKITGVSAGRFRDMM
ncbi:AraC family transcriptional regulator [Paenibacillus sp. CAA11]|uniref:AraC family transcriptional regulator n=1 Tax=Paenibacillus sp. CAA11 TaxID=1532905 RepID=UPI00131F1C05|nr:AraC family transcriptional regulator [Paenibacillus sp. CAA11]